MMTLSRKILARNVALIVGVLLLSTAALAGLWQLRDDVEIALAEYAESRLLGNAEVEAVEAESQLSAEVPDRGGARESLLRGVEFATRYLELQDEADEGTAAHEELEQRKANSARAALARAAATLESGPPDASDAERRKAERAASADIRAAVRDLRDLTRDADALVSRTAHRATSSVRRTLVAVASVAGVIVVSTLAIAVLQYRGMMGPLRSILAGVRAVAAGRFSQRLDPQGEREFAQLAEEFNRMAAELDGLYRGLEAQVQARSRELVRSERLASVGFLAAGVAHEINSPLLVISGYAELSLKRLRAAADAKADPAAARAALDDAGQTLAIIRDESFRCKGITEKLLSLSQPGSAARDRTPVSLAATARDVAQIVQGHQACRERRIELALDESDPLVADACEPELKQVLINLVINGLEAVPPGEGCVRLSGDRAGGWVRLRVDDNGCGMSSTTLQHVFEPFFSEKRRGGDEQPASAAGRRGLGLGLSISHRIVEDHGGRLTATSDGVGGGSSFLLSLPAVAVEGPAAGRREGR